MKQKMQNGKHVLILLLLIVLIGLSSTCKNPLQAFIADDIAPKYANIIIRLNLDAVQNGSSIIDFGEVLIEETASIEFIIENQGENELQLTDDPPVTIEDAAGVFSVTSMPGSRVAAGATTGFSITFSPLEAGNHIAKVVINSNCEENASYEFSIIGLGLALPEPEINVTQGATVIASGGSFDFGSTVINTPKSYSFVIENTGAWDLNITGSPKIAYSGADASDFSTPLLPSSPIPSGGSSSFTVELESPDVETISAVLIIENNDSDEGSYTINLTGEITATPEPEINIKQGSTDIPDGTGTYEFGTITLGNTVDVVFTIENKGSLTLNLDGTGDGVDITGSDLDQFAITVAPGTPVAVSDDTTFTLRFAPDSTGVKTASISIPNDDTDEDPYTFQVTGTVIDPAIRVNQGGSFLEDGAGSYTFADTTLGTTTAVVFTVHNDGVGALVLTGTPAVSIGGTHSTQFSITQQPASPVAESGSSDFTIRFNPTSLGAKNATISIDSNDDDRSPYTFSISGQGTGPEIDLFQDATPIADGSGVYTFADTRLDIPTDVEFTIENNGDEDLILDGVPKIAISGTDANQFSVFAQPSSPVAGAGSTTFTIRFAPDSIGDKTATITIANNEYNENPYTFTIMGTAAWAGIQTAADGYAMHSIAVSGNSVYLAGTQLASDAVFTKSIDGGYTWPESYIKGVASVGYQNGWNRDIAVSGSNIYISFGNYQSPTSTSFLKCVRSPDSGTTWYTGTSSTVESNVSSPDDNSIAVDNGNIYISYHGNTELKFAKSTDGGVNWTKKIVDTTNYEGEDSSIAVSGSAVYISYYETYPNQNYNLKFAKSVNGGTNWTLSYIDMGDVLASSSIALSGNDIFVSYVTTDNNLQLAKSVDVGDTWPTGDIQTVDSSGNVGGNCSIAVSGDDIFICYVDITNNYLKFAASSDSGENWTISTIDSSGNVSSTIGPDMALSGGYLYVVYYDNNAAKIAKSIDGGVTW